LKTANEILNENTEVINGWLDRLMPSETTPPELIHKAMRYSVFAGGKRLRPTLAILAFKWAGGKGNSIFPPACALELIHTYSLIHDDLPCMDDDDLRRGKPTSHKVFGEAIAILAGDALHALAFELAATGGKIAIVSSIARAIGTQGLVGGQVYDMLSERSAPDQEIVEKIHMGKTAALITVSLLVGAMMADAPQDDLEAITKYGQKMGLAFQIIDDILDITADEKTLGKPIGSDIQRKKATYPAVYGIEKSREIALSLIDEAKCALPKNKDNEEFFTIADFIASRGY